MTTQHNEEQQQVNDIIADVPGQGETVRKKMTQRERQRRRCLHSLLLVAATILCINAAVTSLLISWRTPTVVSFDMKGTVDQFTGQAGEQALDEAQSAALTARFITSLNDELQAYQHRHDALILVSPAVVSGSEDITDEIQAGVAQRMASGGSKK